MRTSKLAALSLLLALLATPALAERRRTVVSQVSVATPLPLEPEIDFGGVFVRAGGNVGWLGAQIGAGWERFPTDRGEWNGGLVELEVRVHAAGALPDAATRWIDVFGGVGGGIGGGGDGEASFRAGVWLGGGVDLLMPVSLGAAYRWTVAAMPGGVPEHVLVVSIGWRQLESPAAAPEALTTGSAWP